MTTWEHAKHHVHSHPRSGTHYLMAVVNENFIHAPGRFRDAWGHDRRIKRFLHGLPSQCDPSWFNEGQHFYIWREFDAVAKSILSMPKRFGITKNLSLEEFSEAKWGDIYEPKVRWSWRNFYEVSDKEEGKIDGGDSTAFGSVFHKLAIEMVTRDYWALHLEKWKEFAEGRENIHVVRYEDLLENFQDTMESIASFLGSDRKTFEQVTKKVGGQPR